MKGIVRLEYRKNSTGNNRVESLYHAEGRYLNLNAEVNNTLLWQKEYALRDHLGNTKMLFSDKNANGIVETPGEIVQVERSKIPAKGREKPLLPSAVRGTGCLDWDTKVLG